MQRLLAEPRPVMSPPRWLTRHVPAIEAALRRSGQAPGLLGRMVAFHMGWADEQGRAVHGETGKRFRPSLTLWAAEAAGGAAEEAMPAALAIEWLHNFTLIHDDIEDQDRLRHHRSTLWARWGVAQAINVGDWLFALAFAQLLGGGAHPRRRQQAGRVLTLAIDRVIRGQMLDISAEGRPQLSPTAYMRLIGGKTGALLGASLECGALMAGASATDAARFQKAGRRLGLCFQLRDDWLGTWGNPAQTGKAADADLHRRKVGHPIVAAYAVANSAQRSELRALFHSPDATGTARIRALLLELGGPDLTANAAADLATAAVAALKPARLSGNALEEFSEIARYVAGRDH
jgi:geranylgeranyl diphosphate synthase type I